MQNYIQLFLSYGVVVLWSNLCYISAEAKGFLSREPKTCRTQFDVAYKPHTQWAMMVTFFLALVLELNILEN